MKSKNRISLAVSICMLLVLVGASIIPVTPTEVLVDIKPDGPDDPNPLNLKSKGVFSVAICGTEEFDVTTIDSETVQLTRDGVDDGVSPLRWNYENVSGDEYLDLELKFDTETVVEALLAEAEGNETITLTLTWELIEGEDPTWGNDTIVTRPMAFDCPCWSRLGGGFSRAH